MSIDGSGAKFDAISITPEAPALIQAVPVMDKIVRTVKAEQPELVDYWRNTGRLADWSGVMLGVKPGAVAISEHNLWMLEAVSKIDPELASHYDVIGEVQLGVFGEQENEDRKETIFVNRVSVVELVNSNLDFFKTVTPVTDYSDAKAMVVGAFADSERDEVVRGMINGFNRKDCEAFFEVMPVTNIFKQPLQDRMLYYASLGFGKVQSRFIDSYLNGSRTLSSFAVDLLASKLPITERQKLLLKSRITWKEKLSGTRWQGFEENKKESSELVKKLHKAFVDSGMAEVIK